MNVHPPYFHPEDKHSMYVRKVGNSDHIETKQRPQSRIKTNINGYGTGNEICSRTVHDTNTRTPFSVSTFEKLTRMSKKRHPSCNVRPKFHQWDFVPMHLHSDNTVTAVRFKYQPKSADFHSIITSLIPSCFRI